MANRVKSSQAVAFRRLLELDSLAIGVGAHDAIAAHLVAQSGFHYIWASGLAISTSQGVPDASILGVDRFLDAARTMAMVVPLPVIADCDTGFGGINNAIYMAELYARAGIAGVCIEDKAFPKRNSFADVEHDLESIADFCAKLKAIRRAVGPEDLYLIGRTEAYVAGRGEEAVDRALAYAEAGADAILVHSKACDMRDVEHFMARWDREVPVVIVPTTYPDYRFEVFREAGVASVICANQMLRASIHQMSQVLGAISTRGHLGSVDNQICSVHEVVSMFDGPRWVGI